MPRENNNNGGAVSVTQFSLLEQRVGGVEGSVRDLTHEIKTWMQARTTHPWKLVALCAAILVPIGWTVGVYINAAVSPWATMANQAKATSDQNSLAIAAITRDVGTLTTQSADSIRDRQDQRSTLSELIRLQSENRSRIAETNAERVSNEREVETQIDAMAQMLSIQFANQQRTNSDHQNALHDLGAKVPQAPNNPFYFPNISNRDHHRQ
jgi:hypothetical protein